MKRATVTLSLLALSFNLVNAQTISTIAGSGPSNNVSATSFGVETFGAVADKHGNLYVSDKTWSVVRKINLKTGIATIVAGTGNFGYSGDGGQATAAGLNSPAHLAIDTAGNLYIGDLGGYAIRKVDMSTGIITRVAGNLTSGYSGDGGPATAAQLNSEPGIGFDKNNNMFIADFGNSRVREVNAVTGIITTIAGTGTAGYNGDNIAATAAELNYPSGVCVDDSGNVYISEQNNCRVRKVNTKGIITTVAGTGTYAYGGDGGPATAAKLWCPLDVKLDSAGNLFIADWGNNRIRKVNVSTGIITTVAGNGINSHSGDGGPATSAEIGNAYCVTFDSANNYYIVEGFNPIVGYNVWIRKVDAATNNISTVAGNGSSDYSGDGIPATTAQLAFPVGITTDPVGNIYISDSYNNKIRKINSSDTISTYAGNGKWGYLDGMPGPNGEMYAPYYIASDNTGNIYAADYYNNRIRKININDSIRDFAGNGFGAPYNGNFTGDKGPATLAELFYPTGVAVDDSGNVFISDFLNQRIREIYRKTGDINTIAGTGTSGYSGDGGPATAATISYPFGIATDDSGNVYFADAGNNRVRRIDASTGKINTVAGNGTLGFSGDGGPAGKAELAGPEGITIDKYGNLYIADAINNRIRIVNYASGAINTIAGNGTLGFSGDGGPATAAELNSPTGLALDASGNLYITDYYNNRVRMVKNAVTGISNIQKPTALINIYPNPSNGVFNLSIRNEELGMNYNITVYNTLGLQVYSSGFLIPNSQFLIDLSDRPSGIYLYRVITETGTLIGEGKLVVQH